MGTQPGDVDRIAAALPDAELRLYGSATDPRTMDGWSDVDLAVITDEPVPVSALAAEVGVWAYEDVRSDSTEVCRMVLTDGRRLDVSITGSGRMVGLQPAPDNHVRFLAAIAATKLGRGDRLIGGHLALELLGECLVLAMTLRDQDLGTTVHRTGSSRDRYADAVTDIVAAGLTITPRPNIVERAVQLYGNWRAELDQQYLPDWDPLTRLIDRGLSQATLFHPTLEDSVGR